MATADESEHPLLSLSADKQAQLVDLVEQGDIDAIANQTGLSRRQVILAGVSLAVGATAGGVTADQLIQEAQAAASTSDSDGNVGTPSDRVDIFAEGVDSNSVDTDQQSVGGQPSINYWPPVIAFNAEITDSSPPTSYTTASLSAPAADANWVFVTVEAQGDGTADFAQPRIREVGTTKSFDLQGLGWAGHGAYTIAAKGIVPLNNNQEIEYIANKGNLSNINIYTNAYF